MSAQCTSAIKRNLNSEGYIAQDRCSFEKVSLISYSLRYKKRKGDFHKWKGEVVVVEGAHCASITECSFEKKSFEKVSR